ncbi:MAG: hypothetical protein A3G87_04335 [Omnitrophica bacterium RIFCSPLOWO2_12_FULL_50_11]|nr:MAG: hypothetical protein A3G87_04335 [Omnitrophica bacterium RIFCSPLOWO2_12_FULL_50_11]
MKSNLFLALVLTFSILVVPVPARAQSPGRSALEERKAAFDPQALVQNAGVPADAAESRITLELKGVDVLDVLKILSARSAMNVVAGKNVRGPVTIYLKDVLVRDALDTIISTMDLAYEDEQGIIRVMTAQEYESKYGRPFRDPRVSKTFKLKHAKPAAINAMLQQLKSPMGKAVLDERTNTVIVTDHPQVVQDVEQAVEALDEPLMAKVFKLEYASVESLEAQLADYLTPSSGLLKVDKRSNQISVTDRRENVEQIGKIVRAFDVRPPQVLIEAQVIEVDLFDAFRYGIDWEFVRTNLAGYGDLALTPTFADPTNLSAPAAALGSGTLSTFELTGTRSGFDAIISILQNVGKTNTLSAPRVTVLNNEEARLADATRQPYVAQTVVQGETTSQTADDVQFVDIGVTLTVVPTISDNDTVILKLKPEVSTQSGTLSVRSVSQSSEKEFTRTQVPIVATQSLETTVIVKSGETLVVGGLIKDTESKTLRKLPLLGDVPVLGALFRSNTVDFHKTELVIFLTPYIVSGDVSSREHEKYVGAEGQLIDFDKVGGFDYAKGEDHSQGVLRKDSKPYWKIDRPARPRYKSPRDLYVRSEPYRGRMNEFEGSVEGKMLPPRDELLRAYQEGVKQTVLNRLQSLEFLREASGTIELALKIRRDGVLEDISIMNAGGLEDRKLKRQLRETAREAAPFKEFPKGLDSESELFLLTFPVDEMRLKSIEEAQGN